MFVKNQIQFAYFVTYQDITFSSYSTLGVVLYKAVLPKVGTVIPSLSV